MNLDEMKRNWSDIDARLEHLEKRMDIDELSGFQSARDRLINRYTRFAIVALIGAIFSLYVFFFCFYEETVGLAVTGYLLVAAAMDLKLRHMLGNIDVAIMSVSEVSQCATVCKRRHHLYQLILIPCCILLIGLMLYTLGRNDEYVSYGIIGGLVVGVCVGLPFYFRSMADYKKLTRNTEY